MEFNGPQNADGNKLSEWKSVNFLPYPFEMKHDHEGERLTRPRYRLAFST